MPARACASFSATSRMPSIHETTRELLPWYVNGTLPEAEKQTLETHLGECLPCRAALRDEQRLERLVRDHDDLPLGHAHGVGKLMARIDGRASSPMHPRPRLGFGLALGAAVVAAAAIGLGLLSPWLPGADERANGEAFTTLSNDAAPGDTAAATGARLDIVFAAGSADSDIEALLRSIDARVLDGPSELGRYTIGVAASDPDAIEALIERLTAEPGVQFVGRSYIETPAAADAPP